MDMITKNEKRITFHKLYQTLQKHFQLPVNYYYFLQFDERTIQRTVMCFSSSINFQMSSEIFPENLDKWLSKSLPADMQRLVSVLVNN